MKFKIFESLIDPKQKTLSTYVWEEDKTLKPDVKNTIFSIIPQNFRINNLIISGSITTNFWTDKSDIDITVFVDADDELLDAYRDYAININETKFIGPHPVNLFFRNDRLEDIIKLDFTDGIYSLIEDKWIKEPTDIEDIYKFLKEPKEMAEKIAKKLDIELEEIYDTIKDIVDIWKMSLSTYKTNASKDKLNIIKEKINNLEIELEEYNQGISEIKRKRAEEYSRALDEYDMQLISKFHTRNLLPWAIIYKYLERWAYFKYYYLFKRILEDDVITLHEVYEIWELFISFSEEVKDVA